MNSSNSNADLSMAAALEAFCARLAAEDRSPGTILRIPPGPYACRLRG